MKLADDRKRLWEEVGAGSTTKVGRVGKIFWKEVLPG